ncbi:MAG: hypothetical protein IBX62_01860 [Coriobacteriia bacterium]|nr:hypothetical protein [Coriobacteriia bacterium]
MEFTVNCPHDGQVEVSLEDVSRVVLRDADRVEIVFCCPLCGASIPLTLRVPNLLMAAIESAEDDAEALAASVAVPVSEGTPEVAALEGEDDPRVRAYCEYFRRQLSRVNCVQDMLHEIDG